MEITQGEYQISTDKSRLDVAFIHVFLNTQSYWAKGIPLEIVEKFVKGSFCFGVYHGQTQVGFARVITDFATIGYLADVFIVEAHRKNRLSKWLVETILAHPDLQGFRRWLLATRDAHELYAKYGFKPFTKPENWMEIHYPNIYEKQSEE